MIGKVKSERRKAKGEKSQCLYFNVIKSRLPTVRIMLRWVNNIIIYLEFVKIFKWKIQIQFPEESQLKARYSASLPFQFPT